MEENTTPEAELPEDEMTGGTPESAGPDPQHDHPSNSGQHFSSDSPDMAEIMRRKKPVRKHVDIPLDPEAADTLAAKEQELEEAEKQLNRERQKAASAQEVGKSLAEGSKIQEVQKTIDRLEKELDELWEESQGSIVRFTFQDIGKKRYDDMISEHPPTPEQKREWEEEGGEGKLAFNVETFPPALLSAASLEPKISLEYAEQIFTEWGNWEVIRLFNTAQTACTGVSSVPKSRRSLTGIDETPTSG